MNQHQYCPALVPHAHCPASKETKLTYWRNYVNNRFWIQRAPVLTELCEDLRLQNHLLPELHPRTTSCLHTEMFRNLILQSLSGKFVPKEINTLHLEKERENKKIQSKRITGNM